jgi:hypothetical protein
MQARADNRRNDTNMNDEESGFRAAEVADCVLFGVLHQLGTDSLKKRKKKKKRRRNQTHEKYEKTK